MEYIKFTEAEKAEMFDQLAGYFYNANFGKMIKSDFELVMFHFYYGKLLEESRNPDGTIDYHHCSDYKISKDLGITQQRVRNLKVKDHLVFERELDWKKNLANLTEHARYDKTTKRVVLNIPDPVLFLEIQNFIEEKGAHIEIQLNHKLMQLRAEYYIDLILELESDSTRKEAAKHLKKLFRDAGCEDNLFDETRIGKSLVDAALDVAAVAADLAPLISAENAVGQALLGILQK